MADRGVALQLRSTDLGTIMSARHDRRRLRTRRDRRHPHVLARDALSTKPPESRASMIRALTLATAFALPVPATSVAGSDPRAQVVPPTASIESDTPTKENFMSATWPTRRDAPATAAATSAVSLLPWQLAAVDDGDKIRPFHINIPEDALVDLRRRIAATRWPDRETVNDRSQGVQLAKFQELVRYWGTDYDWRKAEARLNALPQFMTTIDDVDIHFIHVRSRHPNALPLIMTHGWPGSVIELLKTIGPLTDPTAHGGRAEDAFDLVLPSMPGYGFSGKPTGTGWNPDRIARAWAELMKRLGYTRYVAQGGDWGAPVTSAMARQAPGGLLGIHG